MSNERETPPTVSGDDRTTGLQTASHGRADEALCLDRPVAALSSHQYLLPGLDAPIALMLLKAATFAAAEHAGQPREGLPDPYVNHVLRVAHHAASPSLAALLHDTVEDCRVTFADLHAEGFSARTVELVRLHWVAKIEYEPRH
jgi:(p)ppGpp synthase/HD superfamily hydrolase